MPRGRRSEEAEAGPAERGSPTGHGVGKGKGKKEGRERRKVRRGLRNLITSLEQNRAQLVSSKDNGLNRALDRASKIYKHVSTTRESALDSEFLTVASRLGVERTSKIKTSLKESYDPSMFVAALHNYVKGAVIERMDEGEDDDELEATQAATQATQGRGSRGSDFNWHALGTKVQRLFKVTPFVSFMYGPLSAAAPEKKARKVRTRDAIAEQKTAEEGIDHDNQIGRMTSKRVEEVRDIVRAHPNRNIKELLVHTQSFGQTVENFFHFAFLVKDGFVKLTPADDGEGCIATPAEQPSKEDYAQGVAERKQSIVKLDHATYQRLAAEVRQPMLKTQDYSNIEQLVQKRKDRIAAANKRRAEREAERAAAAAASSQGSQGEGR